MVDLDPWTAGYIRMRQFVESGPRTETEVGELCEAIRATLPFPSPPNRIELVIRADIALVGMGSPMSGSVLVEQVNKLWTPDDSEE